MNSNPMYMNSVDNMTKNQNPTVLTSRQKAIRKNSIAMDKMIERACRKDKN